MLFLKTGISCLRFAGFFLLGNRILLFSYIPPKFFASLMFISEDAGEVLPSTEFRSL